MPHVLFITVVIGVWFHKPTARKIKRTLKFARESYDEVKSHIEYNRKDYRDRENRDLFTGNIYLFVTQNKSKGEDDFRTVLERYKKPKTVSTIRLDNGHK